MPAIGPVKRRDLIRFLSQLGFEGPYSGGRHQFVVRGGTTVRLPNPHESDVSTGLLVRLLRQAGVTREEWEKF
ncbi:MAG TPA: type II toxin-antitoxin system HicA family toxin [Thermoanaerobaculia bacterium]|nr:type II toxin-antitoxin system HicA family toxin [Thermoanaerobaculia bacterium]